MRLTTIAGLSLGLAALAPIAACGTFSAAEEAAPVPDAGSDAGADSASPACPTVVDGPGSCAADPAINLANDPKNCGTCGHSCGSGSCVNGACTPDTITKEIGFGLALAGKTLFLGQAQAVKRTDVDQISEPSVAAQGFLGDLRGLSASGDTLYLSAAQQQYVLPVAGGSPSPNPGLQGLPATGFWYAVPDGTSYYAFVENQKGHLAHLSSGPLASVTEAAAITAVTARASTAFWVVDSADGSTLRGPFEAPKDVARSTTPLGAITDDGEHVYWLDTSAHRLMRGDGDGVGEAIAVEPGSAPTAMTMDGERVIYATVRTEQVVNTFAYVVAVSRCGGPPVVLAKLAKDVGVASLAASDGFVYAATTAGVVRLR